VEQGIDSISFNEDALLNGIKNICEAETKSITPIKQTTLSNGKDF
jgi:hypothetical protein